MTLNESILPCNFCKIYTFCIAFHVFFVSVFIKFTLYLKALNPSQFSFFRITFLFKEYQQFPLVALIYIGSLLLKVLYHQTWLNCISCRNDSFCNVTIMYKWYQICILYHIMYLIELKWLKSYMYSLKMAVSLSPPPSIIIKLFMCHMGFCIIATNIDILLFLEYFISSKDSLIHLILLL